MIYLAYSMKRCIARLGAFMSRFCLPLLVVGFFCLLPRVLHTAMTGGDYVIYGDALSSFEDMVVTGGDYQVFQTGGEFGAANMAGGSYVLRGGYQALERGILSLTLSTTTLNLGQLSPSSVSTAVVTTTVNTDSVTGYTLSLSETGNLVSGGNDINDVADGSVTAGVEEYGFVGAGADSLIGVDTAITGVDQSIATNVAPATNRVGVFTFKASIQQNLTRQGSYSHTATFTLIANP
jgi:hypothetical protein